MRNAGANYRLWIRGKAQDDFWGNDSVFIQFSDSVDSSGSACFPNRHQQRHRDESGRLFRLRHSGLGLAGQWLGRRCAWSTDPVCERPALTRCEFRSERTASRSIRSCCRRKLILNTAPGSLKNDSTILPKSTGGGGGTSSGADSQRQSRRPPVQLRVELRSRSRGTGFLANATVSLGGSAATSVAVVNSSTITALTPARTAGAVDVVVTNTDGQSGTKAQAFSLCSAASRLAVVRSRFDRRAENQSLAA